MLRHLFAVLFFRLVCVASQPVEGGQLCTASHYDPMMATFCKWLSDECLIGPDQDLLFVGQFRHEGVSVRGVGVTRDVRVGEQLVCVKKRCRISDEGGMLGPGGGINLMPRWKQDLFAKLIRMPAADDHFGNSVLLAEQFELGEQSFWAPYLHMLPSIEDFRQFHPFYLEDLQLPPALNLWADWNRSFFETYEDYRGVFEAAGQRPVSWSAVQRAWLLSASRTFSGAGFVPMVDLSNTVENFNVFQRIGHLNAFCLVAQREISAGEEITCDYGAPSKSPFLFFQIYGFVLPNKAHDRTELATMCAELRRLTEDGQLRSVTGANRHFRAFVEYSCRDTLDEEEL